MSEKERREKAYKVSATLVFSGLMILLILAFILGLSILINKGPIIPLLGVVQIVPSTTTGYSTTITNLGTITGSGGAPIVISVACSPTNPVFGCINPFFNYTTGTLTIALIQRTGYNWTRVTVRFVPANTTYSQGVPELSWSPPQAVNVTGGMLNDTIRYVNIPISSGPIAVGTDITGSIWAKYQLNIGGGVSYANMSSAVIIVKQG